MAEEGFPVHAVAAHHWAAGAEKQLKVEGNAYSKCFLLPDGSAPRAGDVIAMPELANTFKLLAQEGKKGFYEGKVAEAIVE